MHFDTSRKWKYFSVPIWGISWNSFVLLCIIRAKSNKQEEEEKTENPLVLIKIEQENTPNNSTRHSAVVRVADKKTEKKTESEGKIALWEDAGKKCLIKHAKKLIWAFFGGAELPLPRDSPLVKLFSSQPLLYFFFVFSTEECWTKQPYPSWFEKPSLSLTKWFWNSQNTQIPFVEI